MLMDIEFIFTRANGQRVAVVGRVKVSHRCDCDGRPIHPHADDVLIDSVIDMDTEEKVRLDPMEILAVEDDALELAYEEVA
jgi:hypothetical protein